MLEAQNMGTSEGNSEELQNSKLGECEVCGSTAAKYTCPRCEVKTCSLNCNKIHKSELECSGIRDNTKFIPLNKFTNLDLQSDYRLLENISRNVEGYRKQIPRRSYFRPHAKLHPALKKLKYEATQRNTTLKFLPPNFVKRKANTTKFSYATKTIYWHIEWVFPDAVNIKICDERFPENEKLCNSLCRCLNQEDMVLQEKLQFYQARDMSGLRIFLKAEQKAGNRFYELDPLLDVKENLRNKIIIEYPTIHVLLKEHADDYDVIDTDDEDGKIDVAKSGNTVVNNIIKKAEKDETSSKSLKNFMFASECSDAEED